MRMDLGFHNDAPDFLDSRLNMFPWTGTHYGQYRPYSLKEMIMLHELQERICADCKTVRGRNTSDGS